jgi:hypothetical protein
MVLDSRLQRLSVFDAAGRFIRAIAVDVWGNRHGTFSDGSVLIAQNRYGGEGLVRQQVALWRVDPGDGHRDSLGAYEGEEQLVERQGNMVLLRPAPFGREGVFAVRGLHVLVGDQGAYQVREYSLDRDLIRLFRVEEPARSVTANDIAALREQLIAEFRGTNIDAWRRTVEEQSYPDVLPAHGAMVVDAVERVWIQDYPRPGSTIVDWWIFDRDWRPVGATRLPTAFEVYEIGEEYVLGKWSDSLDVEHVGMYGLSPP